MLSNNRCDDCNTMFAKGDCFLCCKECGTTHRVMKNPSDMWFFAWLPRWANEYIKVHPIYSGYVIGVLTYAGVQGLIKFLI